MASTSDSTRKRTLKSNVEDGSVPTPKWNSDSDHDLSKLLSCDDCKSLGPLRESRSGEDLRSTGRGSRIADGEDRTEN